MGRARWAGASGVLFGMALIAAQLLLDLPQHDDVDQLVNDFYASGSGQLRVVLAAYLMVAAGLGFVGFVWLAAGEAHRELADSRTLATLLAVAAAVLFAAAGASQGPTYALSVAAFDEPLTTLNRFDVHQAYGLLLGAYCFAGVAIIVLCRYVRDLPRAIARIGYAAGGLGFAAILFFPLFLLPLWAIAARRLDAAARVADRRAARPGGARAYSVVGRRPRGGLSPPPGDGAGCRAGIPRSPGSIRPGESRL